MSANLLEQYLAVCKLKKDIPPCDSHSWKVFIELIENLTLETERKILNEKILKESEERLYLSIEGSGTSIFDWHLGTGEFYLSRDFKSRLGFKKDQQVFLDVIQSLFYNDMPNLNYALDQINIKQKGSFYFESKIRVVSGEYRWFLISGSGYFDRSGNLVRILGSISDIENKKNAELALSRSEKRFSTMISNILGAVYQTDITKEPWGLTFISDPIQKITGFAPEELIHNKEISYFNLLTDDSWKSYQQEIFNAIKKDRPYELEYQIFDKDRHVRHVYEKGRCVFDENRNPLYLEGFVLDITDRKEYEAQLETTKAKSIASAKLASLGEMAGGVAHEINNPLAVISLNASQMIELIEDPEINKGELKIFAEKILKTTTRIDRIVKGLKSFARGGEIDPFISTSIKSIIENTLELCSEKLKKHSVDLRLKNIVDISIECRESQIGQVLLNLISNSVDAIDKLEDKWIEIEVKDLDGYIVLDVTDSGNGIPDDVAEKIMQPFFTTKDVGKGTGLGLSISKGIIESHKGRFRLDRKSPHTKFSILLPKFQKS